MIIAASTVRRWRVVVCQPIPRAPIFTWRAVHMNTGRTLRGAATSHNRASLCATHATARLDADQMVEEARAAAHIARLIQREEDSRREANAAGAGE